MSESERRAADSPRFAFGRNWSAFLGRLDEQRIEQAKRSLQDLLHINDLAGKKFLDVGSGSGLFSLAARSLGAEVVSFDYDAESVGCTESLRQRFFPEDPRWAVLPGSVLDCEFLSSLGQHDVVYAWGVLHHTGDLWEACDNVCSLVRVGGRLVVALYNDQGATSQAWRLVKKTYCSGAPGRALVLGAFLPYWVLRGAVVDLLRGEPPTRRYSEDAGVDRGMSVFHDWFDWLGGYPFEVAAPEAVFDFFRGRGFALERLRTVGGGLGCNEFVFSRLAEDG